MSEKNTLKNIKGEFDVYTAALVDVISDWENTSPTLWNTDFSIIYPYAWFPGKTPGTITDKISYTALKNLEALRKDTFFKIVLSRSALFELLISIYRELERLKSLRINDGFDYLKRADFANFLDKNVTVSGLESANKIQQLHNLLPVNNRSHNIQNVIDFLLEGKIISFHDILDREEILGQRDQINKLSEFIRKHHYRGTQTETEFTELHRLVDCRNIATSMILNKHFPEININFVGPTHQIRTDEFKAVHRSYMVPAFSLHALASTENRSAAKNYSERLLEKFNSVSRDLTEYNSLNEVPAHLLEDIQSMFRVVDEMTEFKPESKAHEIEKMRQSISDFAKNKNSFKDKIHEEEDKLKSDALSIIRKREINEGLLHDLGCADNPRAKEVLARFKTS